MLSHKHCQDFLDISAQMLKGDLTDILTVAAVSPEAALKAVSSDFSKLIDFYVTFNTRMTWYMNEYQSCLYTQLPRHSHIECDKLHCHY